MRRVVREHVVLVTVLLTVVSLAAVFGTVLGYVPAGLFPHVDPLVAAVPHLNAAISLCAIGTILVGVRAIRRGDVARHRVAMLTTTALFVTFLVLYLYRLAVEGQTTFGGPAWVRRFVYLPALAVHILLAIVAVPLVYYALLVALTRPVSAIRGSDHARVGRLAAVLWFVSFALGIVVYLFLYALF